ncbi:hypothetical protein [Actinoplanes sp. NPDC049265]|uniref:hypothetical protein n=1 Tax=Actinoplanes sp. NPDC049265 TaxID=3363902 RepID=UPI003719E854
MTALWATVQRLLVHGLLEDLQNAIEAGDANGAITMLHTIASVAGARYANRIMAALIEAGHPTTNGPESSGGPR